MKPKKVVKCVSTKVKSPRKWFSPKQKSPKSRLVLPDITNIPQINIESPKSDVAIRNVRILNENTYVKNKENLDISGIENLSFASADLPKKKTFTGVDVNYRTEENFDDSLEADKNIISTRPSVTCAKRDFGTGTPLSMEEKLNALMFTPTSNGFEPHSFSTEDGTRILASNRLDFDNAISNICNAMPLNTDPNFMESVANLSSATYIKRTDKGSVSSEAYSDGLKSPELNFDAKLETMSSETFTKNSDKCNLSSATYKIDRKSPELILEERLSNISSDTYIKANISASTYTKEGIPVEFNFSGSAPSPIATEAYHEEVLYRSEYIYQTEVVHNRQCLEQILEESHVSSDVSEINRTSRKRRSEYNLKVASPKRKSQNFGNSNHSFQDMGHKVVPVCKRSFKPIKSLNLKEMMEKSRDNLTTVEENIGKV